MQQMRINEANAKKRENNGRIVPLGMPEMQGIAALCDLWTKSAQMCKGNINKNPPPRSMGRCRGKIRKHIPSLDRRSEKESENLTTKSAPHFRRPVCTGTKQVKKSS